MLLYLITKLGVIIRIFFNTFPVLLIINSTIRRQRTPPNKVRWFLIKMKKVYGRAKKRFHSIVSLGPFVHPMCNVIG